MRFSFNVQCNNAAFEGPERQHEIARMLSVAAEEVSLRGIQPGDSFVARDVNGNKVGEYALTDD